eukprot:756547-Hanusia_phi.AAC.9
MLLAREQDERVFVQIRLLQQRTKLLVLRAWLAAHAGAAVPAPEVLAASLVARKTIARSKAQERALRDMLALPVAGLHARLAHDPAPLDAHRVLAPQGARVLADSLAALGAVERVARSAAGVAAEVRELLLASHVAPVCVLRDELVAARGQEVQARLAASCFIADAASSRAGVVALQEAAARLRAQQLPFLVVVSQPARHSDLVPAHRHLDRHLLLAVLLERPRSLPAQDGVEMAAGKQDVVDSLPALHAFLEAEPSADVLELTSPRPPRAGLAALEPGMPVRVTGAGANVPAVQARLAPEHAAAVLGEGGEVAGVLAVPHVVRVSLANDGERVAQAAVVSDQRHHAGDFMLICLGAFLRLVLEVLFLEAVLGH